jgi:hypothetical protein
MLDVNLRQILTRGGQGAGVCKGGDFEHMLPHLIEEDRGALMCIKQRLDNTPISVSALDSARMKSLPDNDNGEAIDTACGEHSFLTDSR